MLAFINESDLVTATIAALIAAIVAAIVLAVGRWARDERRRSRLTERIVDILSPTPRQEAAVRVYLQAHRHELPVTGNETSNARAWAGRLARVPPDEVGVTEEASRPTSLRGREAPGARRMIRSRSTMVIGALAIAAFIGGAVASSLSHSRDTGRFAELLLGDCYDAPGSPFTNVYPRACQAQHDFEVFAKADYSPPASTYPTKGTLETFASNMCHGVAFTAYTASSYFDPGTPAVRIGIPSETAWKDGDREIDCVLVRSGGTGSQQYVRAHPARSGVVHFTAMRIGECLLRRKALVLSECSISHDLQVDGNFDYLPATQQFPGARQVASFGDSICGDTAVHAFTGQSLADSPYTSSVWIPSRSDWAGGDHAVLCTLAARGGGELKGSADGHSPPPTILQTGPPQG